MRVILGLILIVSLGYGCLSSSKSKDATTAGSPAPSGCGKDTDCKGDRLCIKGTCQDASLSSGGGRDSSPGEERPPVASEEEPPPSRREGRSKKATPAKEEAPKKASASSSIEEELLGK